MIDLKSLGLGKSDTLLVQANVVNLVRQGMTVPKIFDMFMDVVGTLVVPTFQAGAEDFVKNGFDIRNTPSKMGVLSEYVRTRQGAVRSGHPIYSFSAVGVNASLFNTNNYVGYGKDSPFNTLRLLGGVVGVLGLVNSQGNTIIHHVEELNRVPYRKYKRFTGLYTDRYGVTEERTYGFYCNGGVKTLLDPLDDLAWANGLYRGDRPYDGHGFRVADANKFCALVESIIKDGEAEGILYERI